MRNRNGFTLIELLSVVVILTVVMGIVSIAYIKITDYIDKLYYEGIEQTLLQSAGEYYTYNQKKQSQIFGNVEKIYLDDLISGEYITKVVDRKGKECLKDNNNKSLSYVGFYKNSLDKVNYFVCLKCDKYESEACLDEVDYS